MTGDTVPLPVDEEGELMDGSEGPAGQLLATTQEPGQE